MNICVSFIKKKSHWLYIHSLFVSSLNFIAEPHPRKPSNNSYNSDKIKNNNRFEYFLHKTTITSWEAITFIPIISITQSPPIESLTYDVVALFEISSSSEATPNLTFQYTPITKEYKHSPGSCALRFSRDQPLRVHTFPTHCSTYRSLTTRYPLDGCPGSEPSWSVIRTISELSELRLRNMPPWIGSWSVG